MKSSRIPGFYKRTLKERAGIIADWADLTEKETNILLHQGLPTSQAVQMVENGIGIYELPLGIACNFTLNGRDYLIPMAIEEPSVIAAVSFAAKLIRAGGGSPPPPPTPS